MFIISAFVCVVSFVSILFILFLKELKQSKSIFDKTDIDVEGIDCEVLCVEDVFSSNNSGSILFRDTKWEARCTKGKIKKGELAKIIGRRNLTYIVEKL